MSEKRAKRIKHDILMRVRALYIVFILIGGVIALRIGWIQLFSREVAINAENIHGRIFRPQVVKAHRGSILARNGEPLATSILRYQVEMDFGSEGFDSLNTYYKQSDSLSKLLSAYFGDRTTAEYQKFFRENRREHYQLVYLRDSLVNRSDGWFDRIGDVMRGESMMVIKLYDTIRDHSPVPLLPREIDYSEWQTLRRYPILNWNMGMTYSLSDREDRVYAQGGRAQRTIGAINADRGDDYGVEAIYNDRLKGVDGEEVRQRIARGFYGRVAGGVTREAVDGLDIVTTIDVDIQDVAEASLRRQVEEQKAIWGTTIVMEVATGDILAIANLDRREDGSYAELRNRAIGARTEPGSTFKLMSTMALLEVAKMPTSTIIDSENGARVKVGNAWVQDSHKEGHEVDLHTAFIKSLNVYFAKAIYENFKDEPTRYTDFLKSLSLDRPMGLEEYGELAPRLPEQGMRGLWTPHMTLVNMAYGYGVEVSPIQTLTLYNAVANGGRMVAPRLVREVRREEDIVEKMEVEVLSESICSQPTLDTLQGFLRGVCSEGTAQWYLGRFKGFEAAAKTGTAQFAQDGYQYRDGIYIGSLVGYMPADNPKYSVITVLQIKRGKARTIYGAGLAGPVVQEVMQHLYNRESQWHTQLDTIPEYSVPRSIKGGDIASIRRVVDELTPNSAKGIRGSGLASVDHDSLDRVVVTPILIEDGKMPNLYGMGLRDAIYLLEGCGLKVTFEGTGRVFRQSVRAGSKVKSGDVIHLYMV